MAPKEMLFAQIKLNVEPSLKRSFAQEVDGPVFSDIELSDRRTLRIQADPDKGTFTMSSPRVVINGKIDKDFNIHSCQSKSLLNSSDSEYQTVLDGLLANNLKFQKKTKSDQNIQDSEYSPYLPGQ